ncbi:MAG TPA: ATP synthase F1 subunit gamma [Firmicutes bacterium]|jgi:F-type H+-transporting ATPase subunit gamma|nr:ATP synthase F1 subunit gamma [Bacillota bacterium]HBL69424.1 ATP synthase F1 subunit gamma [Bacillota bacterium]HCX70393.1 ATP synthase F1 subunit gamma [Bacillota bacterium]
MESRLEIRRRIRGIREIYHITKAMKLVAATHLKKAQERVAQARPYARKISEVMVDLHALSRENLHPLMEVRPVKRVLFIVITADKGLAGSYSQNIVHAFMEHYRSLPGNPQVAVIAVGKRGRDHFRKAGIETVSEYIGVSHHTTFAHAVKIGGEVEEYYQNRRFDEVFIVYSRFNSVTSQQPRCFRLLPVIPIEPGAAQACGSGGTGAVSEEGARAAQARTKTDWIFEPSPREILDFLVPRYVETEIYRALLEADAGERGARMTSMSAASDSAKELMDELIMKYHHLRQDLITREITELAGGAELIRADSDAKGVNGGT